MSMIIEMQFEMAMRMLFGKNADNIADEHFVIKDRRKWLKKVGRKLTKEIDNLDTKERHKEKMLSDLIFIAELLNKDKEPSWSLVYRFIELISRLLGFDTNLGTTCFSPVYWQTKDQYEKTILLESKDIQEFENKLHDEYINVVNLRRSIVKNLKEQGVNDYTIALVLNTSEHKVKKIRYN